MNKPLTPKILSDPSHKLVQTLVYIYSMQTFIFTEMNKASRAKDIHKIKFYGPLASALSMIIHSGNHKNTGLPAQFSVYRGLQITPKELKHKYKKNNFVNLNGYTSTSLEKATALEFALNKLPDNGEKCAVLIEIRMKGRDQFFFLNSEELSAYSHEQEVLLQDGLKY